jgi:hypothetical protein
MQETLYQLGAKYAAGQYCFLRRVLNPNRLRPASSMAYVSGSGTGDVTPPFPGEIAMPSIAIPESYAKSFQLVTPNSRK